jgi:hypothetical protein
LVCGREKVHAHWPTNCHFSHMNMYNSSHFISPLIFLIGLMCSRICIMYVIAVTGVYIISYNLVNSFVLFNVHALYPVSFPIPVEKKMTIYIAVHHVLVKEMKMGCIVMCFSF